MTKLSKRQLRDHNAAMERLQQDTLSWDDKWFVLENIHEGGLADQTRASAFFTPPMLARDFSIDIVYRETLIDLCAGIGTLAFMALHMDRWYPSAPQITCVEINPAYVEIGRKLLPEAHWICADVFEVWESLGKFGTAIANPPFGSTTGKGQSGPRYDGTLFEYKLIDIASQMADFGTFIIPQGSAPFQYSGRHCYERREPGKFISFQKATGIDLEAGCGIDTTVHRDDWKNASPLVEVVTCEFAETLTTPPAQMEFLLEVTA